MGTALFHHGRLMPHLELAHHPFRKGQSYNEQLGDAARKRLGNRKWTRRVQRAVRTLDALFFFDRLYVGGGNAPRLTAGLGPKAVIVDNLAGILGGAKLWECL
jgi:polyphosphate glucokinase